MILALNKPAERTATFNPGLALLRALLCFGVICCHFFEPPAVASHHAAVGLLCDLAVPTFMLLSFTLVGNSLANAQPGYALKRLKRMLVPIAGWAIILFFWLPVASGEPLTASDLLFQILTGHAYNTPMWFMNVLLLLTLAAILIYKLPRKVANATLLLLAAAALALQISGVNHALFSPMDTRLSYPLGRIAEMIPYCAIGIWLSIAGIDRFAAANRRTTFLAGAAIFAVCLTVWGLDISEQTPDFDNAGVRRICFSVGLLLIAISAWPAAPDRKSERALKLLTDFTLGIYCIHFAAGYAVLSQIAKLGIHPGSLLSCMAIYAACYLACLTFAIICRLAARAIDAAAKRTELRGKTAAKWLLLLVK